MTTTSCSLLSLPQVEPEALGDIVVGSVLGPSSQRANECRIASFFAGIPETVPVRTVNRQADKPPDWLAAHDARQKIRSGMAPPMLFLQQPSTNTSIVTLSSAVFFLAFCRPQAVLLGPAGHRGRGGRHPGRLLHRGPGGGRGDHERKPHGLGGRHQRAVRALARAADCARLL